MSLLQYDLSHVFSLLRNFSAFHYTSSNVSLQTFASAFLYLDVPSQMFLQLFFLSCRLPKHDLLTSLLEITTSITISHFNFFLHGTYQLKDDNFFLLFSLLKFNLLEGRDFSLFCSLPNPQHLETMSIIVGTQ